VIAEHPPAQRPPVLRARHSGARVPEVSPDAQGRYTHSIVLAPVIGLAPRAFIRCQTSDPASVVSRWPEPGSQLGARAANVRTAPRTTRRSPCALRCVHALTRRPSSTRPRSADDHFLVHRQQLVPSAGSIVRHAVGDKGSARALRHSRPRREPVRVVPDLREVHGPDRVLISPTVDPGRRLDPRQVLNAPRARWMTPPVRAHQF
jgi:hypothetical protein